MYFDTLRRRIYVNRISETPGWIDRLLHLIPSELSTSQGATDIPRTGAGVWTVVGAGDVAAVGGGVGPVGEDGDRGDRTGR